MKKLQILLWTLLLAIIVGAGILSARGTLTGYIAVPCCLTALFLLWILHVIVREEEEEDNATEKRILIKDW